MVVVDFELTQRLQFVGHRTQTHEAIWNALVLIVVCGLFVRTDIGYIRFRPTKPTDICSTTWKTTKKQTTNNKHQMTLEWFMCA